MSEVLFRRCPVLCCALQYSMISKGLEVDDIHLSKESLEVSIIGKCGCIHCMPIQ